MAVKGYLGQIQGPFEDSEVTPESIANGMKQYQVYKNPGTNLTDGKDFAQFFKGTSVGTTVVTPEQLKGQDANELAKQIQKDMSNYYDTVIVVVDGKDSDTISYFSSTPGVNIAFSNMKTVFDTPVPDAGKALNGSKEQLLVSYADGQGGVSMNVKRQVDDIKASGQQEAKAKADAAAKAQADAMLKDPTKLVDNSVKGLGEYQIFKHPGTNISNADSLLKMLEYKDASVVVITPEQAAGKNLKDIAKSIQGGLGTDWIDGSSNVIVIEDGGTQQAHIGGYSIDPATNEAMAKTFDGQTYEDAGFALLTKSDAWMSAYKAKQDTAHAERAQQNAELYSSFLSIGGTTLGALALIAAAVTLWRKSIFPAMKRRKSEREAARNSVKNLVSNRFKHYSDEFQEALINFAIVAEEHDKQLNAKDSLSKKMNNIVSDLERLSKLLRGDKNASQRSMFELQYTNRLKKMGAILGEDYYIDMVLHPKSWSSVKKRTGIVRTALDSMQEELTNNTIQVNESRELDFRSALHSFLDADEMEVEGETVSVLASSQDLDEVKAKLNGAKVRRRPTK